MRQLIILMTLLLITACQPEIKETPLICEPPMVPVAGECCLDENANFICDMFEQPKEEKVKKQEEQTEIKHITIEELEEKINKTFRQHYKNYDFKNGTEENATGIKATFEVRTSTNERFKIFKIKKQYNYLQTYENFSSFVEQLHRLERKDWKISSEAYIDYMRSTDKNWKNVYYEYEYSLKKVNDTDIFLEEHQSVFIRPKNACVALWGEIKGIVWCSPELVVEVRRKEPSNYGWTEALSPMSVKGSIEIENRAVKEEITEAAKQVSEMCS